MPHSSKFLTMVDRTAGASKTERKVHASVGASAIAPASTAPSGSISSSLRMIATRNLSFSRSCSGTQNIPPCFFLRCHCNEKAHFFSDTKLHPSPTRCMFNHKIGTPARSKMICFLAFQIDTFLVFQNDPPSHLKNPTSINSPFSSKNS